MIKKLLLCSIFIISKQSFCQISNNSELKDTNENVFAKDSSSILEPKLKWVSQQPLFFIPKSDDPKVIGAANRPIDTDVSIQGSNIKYYTVGQNGIEFVVKKIWNGVESSILISTFNAKLKIKNEIAEKVYDYFAKSNFSSGTKITIDGDLAKVIGTCYVEIKGSLTILKFYYSQVEWNDGLIEIFKKS